MAIFSSVVPVVSVGAHETLLVLWDGAPLARALGLDRSRRLQVFPLLLALPWGLFLGVPPLYLPLPAHIEMRVLPAMRPPPDPALLSLPQALSATCTSPEQSMPKLVLPPQR